MPTPGFPEWLGPGAVVIEAATHNRDTNEIRYVVMDVELQLPETTWDGAGNTEGGHIVALMPLTQTGDLPVLTFAVDRAGLHTLNLSALLDLYQWTGEYLMPDGRLHGVATTMPTTFHMGALRPNERLVIQGAGDLDGEYLISAVDTHHAAAGRRHGIDITLVDPDVMDRRVEAEQIAVMPRDFLPGRVDYDLALQRQDLPDRDLDVDAPVVPAPDPSEIETGRPVVAANQVWLLPAPNAGLWRTSFSRESQMTNAHVRSPQLTLTHARERDRVMRCTGHWLIEHGVRQEPPDPRSSRPNQAIVIGQVWEFNPDAGTRYRRVPRWRVLEVNEGAGQVCLIAEDGTGKRIYLPPARIVALATYSGNGVPRRTAFEHILDDNDD